jgi:uncharacterized RDD family membrane protein YckC
MMNREEGKGPSEPKPRYVWDPKKLAWVETTETEIQEAAAESAAIEPETAEVTEESRVKARAEEVVEEAEVEAKAEEDTGVAVAESAAVESVAVQAAGPQYKGAGIRLAALLIDLVVFLVISIIVGQVSGASGLINSTSGQTVARVVTWQQWMYIGIITTYFVGFWAWRGQTPGKMLTGLKVVKTNGRPIGVGRAVLRYVVFFLYLMLWGFTGTLAFLFAIIFGVLIIIPFNKKKRTIHDFIAGTVVVGSRAPAPQPVEAEASGVSETAEVASASELSDPSGASESEADKTEQEK